MKRMLALAVMVGCLSTGLAVDPAQAAELDPVLAAAMVRPGDLSPTYAKPTKVWNNDLGKGVVPISCTTPESGSPVLGRVARTAYFKEIDYRANNTTWQDTIFMYSSAKGAATSYARLLRGAKAQCSSIFDTTIGDDGKKIPVTQANSTRVLAKADGKPRFAVATRMTLGDEAQAYTSYHDAWSYGVFLLDGSVIHQIQIYQDGPITPLEAEDARKAVATTATRFSLLP